MRCNQVQPNSTNSEHITNSVTLATRVCAEIILAMANQFATYRGQMYVSTWDITTKLHVKQAGSLRDSYALTFGEALLRFGRELQKEHPVAAYRRAGQSFGRLLE